MPTLRGDLRLTSEMRQRLQALLEAAQPRHKALVAAYSGRHAEILRINMEARSHYLADLEAKQ